MYHCSSSYISTIIVGAVLCNYLMERDNLVVKTTFTVKIASMLAAFVQLQKASVLPMHGFDPVEDMYTTTKEEGRY